MKALIQKGQHPIFGSSRKSVHVQKFFPRPGKKTNRVNEKIEVDPSEKVDHDSVSKINRNLSKQFFLIAKILMVNETMTTTNLLKLG